MEPISNEATAGITTFADEFDGDRLNEQQWVPAYLPHWSSRARAAARYELTGHSVCLRVDPDQEPWCPEFDGEVRVSSLQTGVFAGPLGSSVGQHRFRPDLVVREEQLTRWLFTPHHGTVVVRASADLDQHSMAAVWMIGIEDVPTHAGEICVMEVFGRDVTPASTVVGLGVHPFADPALRDDFARLEMPIDVGDVHDYAATWTEDSVTFYVDGHPVHGVGQSPDYPMQLMLSLYSFRRPLDPKLPRFTVHSVRAFGPTAHIGARD